jgi:protein Hikeshi
MRVCCCGGGGSGGVSSFCDRTTRAHTQPSARITKSAFCFRCGAPPDRGVHKQTERNRIDRTHPPVAPARLALSIRRKTSTPGLWTTIETALRTSTPEFKGGGGGAAGAAPRRRAAARLRHNNTTTMFALAFVGNSYPIPASSFQQVDPTHWVLDVCTAVGPDYSQLKEAALLLAAPGCLPSASAALGLYVACGHAGANNPCWLYRGCVHAGRPSEVVPLSWPTRPDSAGDPFPPGPGVAQVGVALEPKAELEARETSRLGEQLAFGRAVALDLAAYLSSFAKTVPAPSSVGGVGGGGGGGEVLALPPGAIDGWLAKWEARYRRDPDFVLRRARELLPPPP